MPRAGKSVPRVVSGFVVAAALAWALLVPVCPVHAAKSSVNVPLDNYSYEALDLLTGFGLIESDMKGTRPYSRLEMARLIKEALDTRDKLKITLPPIPANLLRRLEKDFKEELVSKGRGEGEAPRTFLKPMDEAQGRYVYSDGDPRVFKGFPKRPYVNATEGTALVQNNEGLRYGQHNSLQLQFSTVAKYDDWFSAYVQPYLILRQNGNDIDGMSNYDFDVLKAYAKVQPWSGLEIEFGRDSMWWGQGRHGSLIMTDNAKNLDMIKLSNPEPALLPWFFQYLGPFKYVFYITQMEGAFTPDGTGLFGMHVDFKPIPILELGFSSAVQFGGKGQPSLTFTDILKMLTFQNPGAGTKSNPTNQLAALEGRLRLPWVWDVEIYGEYGGEDTGGWGMGDNPDEVLFGDVGYLVGLYIPRLTPDGATDFRIEWAKNIHWVDTTPQFWYGHFLYKTGYTNDRYFIGHHMGGDAYDLFTRVSRYFRPDLKVGIDFDNMSRGSSLNPSAVEHVYQVGGDVTFDWSDSMSLQVRYGWEHSKNFNMNLGDNRNATLLMTTVKYQF